MDRKEEYWSHFVSNKKFHGHGFTAKRLEKVKPLIMDDVHFWNDILFRHGGCNMSPQEMEQNNRHNYEHCMGNMMGMTMQVLVENKIITP